jgi:antitoxin component YwqK of YwqJK toxin-antitoxin module
MSRINGISSNSWIIQNRPETGWFRVYWKDVMGPHEGSVTLDPDEGEGLRYEWEYKDGQRADGAARSWYPSGQLKEERTFKNGNLDGACTIWDENGQKKSELFYKDGSRLFI